MIVVVLSSCPPSLRGDLTKWLFEISTGVYIGHIAARVRDSLWERIVSSVGTGRAIMAFSADNDQRFDIRVHNTEWSLEEIDGIKVMMRQGAGSTLSHGFSNASRMRKAMKPRAVRGSSYTAAYIGYSSPSTRAGHITEVDFTIVSNGSVVDAGGWREGEPEDALERSLDIILKSDRLVMYRAGRQVQFLEACANIRLEKGRVTDLHEMIKERSLTLEDTGLESICMGLGIDPRGLSRSGSMVRINERLNNQN